MVSPKKDKDFPIIISGLMGHDMISIAVQFHGQLCVSKNAFASAIFWAYFSLSTCLHLVCVYGIFSCVYIKVSFLSDTFLFVLSSAVEQRDVPPLQPVYIIGDIVSFSFSSSDRDKLIGQR